ncbi:helicase [Actinomadura craniellae]|uniref:Helicase n=1 Tax=Actinomadura craniellae TaxID=2231787 RepID=A0A365GV24_9ACTN|nr:helicase-related protein [Actinomadura craniellae]RAY10644.1 helicase [Actinomadura craniellae]
MSSLAQTRQDFVDYVRRQLVGPFDGPVEIIFDPPNRRYLMGILFPRQVSFAGYIEAEGEESDEAGTDTGDESQFSDDPVSAANDFLPASQGLSFFTTAPHVTVRAHAAEYRTLSGAAAEAALTDVEVKAEPTEKLEDDEPEKKSQGSRKIWRRHELPEATVTITPEDNAAHAIWDGKAEIHVRWRSYPHGSLVTVTLVNAREADDEHPERHWDEMLLQVDFDITVPEGSEVLEYPNVAMASHDPEEDELRLIHRAARVFAIGHGCSPEWVEIDGTVTAVRSEVMPSHVVPRVSAEGDAVQALDVAWLGDESVPTATLVAELNSFIDPYEQWIKGVEAKAATLDPRYTAAAGPVIARLKRALARMRDGAQVFVDHPDRAKLLTAFRLANQAMLIQMRHSKKDYAGSRRPRAAAPEMPSAYDPCAAWRPFQLGFFLTTLRGLVDEVHDDRDVVDLIWFPTGGGKTEAYLLVAAFEIFRRRLVLGEAGLGTAVISRYTLSLLTADQFKRTASTTAACEYLRRRRSGELGDEPISVGLWVGEATSPNTYVAARERFDELRDAGETDDRFLLDRCPWCGTEIVPREHQEDDSLYGVTATDRSFAFNCPSTKCEFHENIPVHVVDQALYDFPPAFLLGTVDKFAQLAWVPESGVLFGNTAGRRPPSLIIQDELHLLTGPLGTTVGLYEAAINLLCESSGRPPKVISSTATIRRASAQIMGLFGRPVDLFPPTGIDADDSYFARVDRDSPGRLYVGMMAQGHTSDTAVVHTGAALLQAPVDLDLTGDAQDAYWTVVAYHSSLRELGRTVTIARDDIHARLGSLVVGRPRRDYDVEELSSSVPRALQPRLLERLNLPVTSGSVVDFLATTNMLSVGVDVPRLGLMLVNGQPKATAEYIQATSRVGRSKAPGLVFGLFRSTKPRDRSHYENFWAYHSALYRHVEPTSVTPFSPPSRDRALHAALVILARHRLGMQSDGSAGQILTRRAEVETLADRLVDVVARVEPREKNGAQTYLARFIEDWIDRAKQADAQSKLLYYRPNGKGQFNLIRQYHTKATGWETLGSMRNVDLESLVEIARSSGSTGGDA